MDRTRKKKTKFSRKNSNRAKQVGGTISGTWPPGASGCLFTDISLYDKLTITDNIYDSRRDIELDIGRLLSTFITMWKPLSNSTGGKKQGYDKMATQGWTKTLYKEIHTIVDGHEKRNEDPTLPPLILVLARNRDSKTLYYFFRPATGHVNNDTDVIVNQRTSTLAVDGGWLGVEKVQSLDGTWFWKGPSVPRFIFVKGGLSGEKRNEDQHAAWAQKREDEQKAIETNLNDSTPGKGEVAEREKKEEEYKRAQKSVEEDTKRMMEAREVEQTKDRLKSLGGYLANAKIVQTMYNLDPTYFSRTGGGRRAEADWVTEILLSPGKPAEFPGGFNSQDELSAFYNDIRERVSYHGRYDSADKTRPEPSPYPENWKWRWERYLMSPKEKENEEKKAQEKDENRRMKVGEGEREATDPNKEEAKEQYKDIVLYASLRPKDFYEKNKVLLRAPVEWDVLSTSPSTGREIYIKMAIDDAKQRKMDLAEMFKKPDYHHEWEMQDDGRRRTYYLNSLPNKKLSYAEMALVNYETEKLSLVQMAAEKVTQMDKEDESDNSMFYKNLATDENFSFEASSPLHSYLSHDNFRVGPDGIAHSADWVGRVRKKWGPGDIVTMYHGEAEKAEEAEKEAQKEEDKATELAEDITGLGEGKLARKLNEAKGYVVEVENAKNRGDEKAQRTRDRDNEEPIAERLSWRQQNVEELQTRLNAAEENEGHDARVKRKHKLLTEANTRSYVISQAARQREFALADKEAKEGWDAWKKEKELSVSIQAKLTTAKQSRSVDTEKVSKLQRELTDAEAVEKRHGGNRWFAAVDKEWRTTPGSPKWWRSEVHPSLQPRFMSIPPLEKTAVWEMTVDKFAPPPTACKIGFTTNQFYFQKYWPDWEEDFLAVVNLQDGSWSIGEKIAKSNRAHQSSTTGRWWSTFSRLVAEAKPFNIRLRISNHVPQIQFDDKGEWFPFGRDGWGKGIKLKSTNMHPFIESGLNNFGNSFSPNTASNEITVLQQEGQVPGGDANAEDPAEPVPETETDQVADEQEKEQEEEEEEGLGVAEVPSALANHEQKLDGDVSAKSAVKEPDLLEGGGKVGGQKISSLPTPGCKKGLNPSFNNRKLLIPKVRTKCKRKRSRHKRSRRRQGNNSRHKRSRHNNGNNSRRRQGNNSRHRKGNKTRHKRSRHKRSRHKRSRHKRKGTR